MARKKWPENPAKTVMFEDILTPLREVVDVAYTVEETPAAKKGFAARYTGFEQGETGRAVSAGPEWSFSREGLQYHRERNRDPMTVILIEAVSAGIEQGRRIERDSQRGMEPGWVLVVRDYARQKGITDDSAIMRLMFEKLRD